MFQRVTHRSISSSGNTRPSRSPLVPRRHYVPCERHNDANDEAKRQDQLKRYELHLCEARTLLFKYTTKDKIGYRDLPLWTQHLKDHRFHRREDIRYHLKQEEDKLRELLDDLEMADRKVGERNKLMEAVNEQLEVVKTIKHIDLHSDDILDRDLLKRIGMA